MTVPALPLLVAPFEGAWPLNGYFDHRAIREAKTELVYTGAVVWGKEGHEGYDYGLPAGRP